MANLNTSKNSSAVKLAENIRESEQRMGTIRQQRRTFIAEYASSRPMGWNRPTARPLDLLFMIVTAMTPALSMDPEVNIEPRADWLTAFGDVFRENINASLREMKFGLTTSEIIAESLFGMAVTKCGVGPAGTESVPEAGNLLTDPGRVFVDLIDLDDYVPDMDANRRECMDFEANRFEPNLEWAAEFYSKSSGDIRKLATERAPRQTKTKNLTTGTRTMGERFVPRVELMDVWLPGENAMVLIAGRPEKVTKYLDEREWIGPEMGPYDTFGVAPVPANLLPKSPLAAIYDLHVLINEVARKIGRQAKRQKSLVAASTGHEQALDTIRDASDGETVMVPDVSQIKEINFGGPNDDNYRTVAWLHDFMNRIAGNPDLLGGTGVNAPTLGQDEMKLGSAMGRVGYWKEQLGMPFNSLLQKVAWFEWTDPVVSRDLTLTLPEGIRIPVRWSPETREGNFLDYMISIDPFARRPKMAEEKLAALKSLMAEIAIPLAEVGAEQGMTLDVEKIMQLAARHYGVPEYSNIFRRGMPTQLSLSRAGVGGQQRPDERMLRRVPASPRKEESLSEAAGVSV